MNLSALDEKTGTSILHEAARYVSSYVSEPTAEASFRRRDLRLVELAVKRGADVFVRDKRGRRVLDGEKGGDERIKAFLPQCQSNFRLQQTVPIASPH